MRSIIFATFLAALAFRAEAAEIIDGSGAGFDKDIVIKIVKGLATQTNDPNSAEIMQLHRTEAGTLCGFVNLKNLAGGYTGFQPFFMLLQADTVGLFGFEDCGTGPPDAAARRQRYEACTKNVGDYISSSGAKDVTETRTCLAEYRKLIWYPLWIKHIKEAGLPLAEEFK